MGKLRLGKMWFKVTNCLAYFSSEYYNQGMLTEGKGSVQLTSSLKCLFSKYLKKFQYKKS
jgi:hypothetical protein